MGCTSRKSSTPGGMRCVLCCALLCCAVCCARHQNIPVSRKGLQDIIHAYREKDRRTHASEEGRDFPTPFLSLYASICRQQAKCNEVCGGAQGEEAYLYYRSIPAGTAGRPQTYIYIRQRKCRERRPPHHIEESGSCMICRSFEQKNAPPKKNKKILLTFPLLSHSTCACGLVCDAPAIIPLYSMYNTHQQEYSYILRTYI